MKVLWLLSALAVSAEVRVTTGPVNSIALPEGAAIYGAAGAKTVLVTHARRDVLWAAGDGALVVPAGEVKLVTEAGKFWSLFRQTRFHDYAQKTTKVPERDYMVARTVRDGDSLVFGDVTVSVLDTPGFTAGAVSYVFAFGGKKYAATGDLIYSGGRVLDLYSLQDAVPETKTRGYHGFAARAGQLIASLRKIREMHVDVIVPARGPVIERPAEEIDRLIGRLQALLDSHFATDALRWYWGEESWKTRGTLAMGRAPAAPMPMGAERDLPQWVIAIGNSRLLVSTTGAAFLMDAGYPQIVEKLEELQQAGRFRNLEGLWVTHYHDDHTDHVSKVAKKFGAKVYFNERIRDIVENPARYRMPCLTTNPIAGEARGEAEGWQWREFKMASYFFPGQTLYHGGLSVERESGEKLFFVGDSFTPSGTDDYCLQNRNFVHADEGYRYCLDLLEKLGGTHWLINQHVAPMFRYDTGQVQRMREELAKRERLLAELTPLPDANYAVDESWARMYPYSVKARAGQTVTVELRIDNHSAKAQDFRVKWNVPAGWEVVRAAERVTIGARTGSAVKATLRAVTPGEVAVLTADVAFAGFDLRRWTEALLERDGE
ncbi:MAG: MBL fold metallo-hydrolase [Acidobacteria bacterium]|nr:MBL fold metallo-hydrolase [Acidobacteriota bacterium]